LERPKPLDEGTVLKMISTALNHPLGKLKPTRHFTEDRMPKRHFDMIDTENVLENAAKVKPVWNTKNNTWNYDIAGKDIDGNSLTIRIAPGDDSKHVVLVTGF